MKEHKRILATRDGVPNISEAVGQLKDYEFVKLVHRDYEVAVCLDLIFRSGKRQAFSYTLMPEFSLEGATLTLTFPTRKITISGQCLHKVYDELLRHRVRSIREMDDTQFHTRNEGEPYPESIIIEEL